MIQYNKKEIKGDYLILDFEIEDKPYYKDTAIIHGVQIDTIDTINNENINEHPHYDKSVSTTHYSAEIFIPEYKKELLIITPIVEYTPTIDICGADKVDTTAVYDKSILNTKGFSYLKELGDTCNTPKGFIDFILKSKALDISIDVCNYTKAAEYWDYLNKRNTSTITSNCGCHGFK